MSISYLGESFDPLITHAEQKLRLGTVARDTFGRQWSYVKFYADVAAGQYVRDMKARSGITRPEILYYCLTMSMRAHCHSLSENASPCLQTMIVMR